MPILGEKIHDQWFLRLVRNMLRAGYLEDWKWGATHSGAPQGGVPSPVPSNNYLHKLDEFVETVFVPEYTRGKRRARTRPVRSCRTCWEKPAGAATGSRPVYCVKATTGGAGPQPHLAGQPAPAGPWTAVIRHTHKTGALFTRSFVTCDH